MSEQMQYSNRVRVDPALTDQGQRIPLFTYNTFDVPTSINQLNTNWNGLCFQNSLLRNTDKVKWSDFPAATS